MLDTASFWLISTDGRGQLVPPQSASYAEGDGARNEPASSAWNIEPPLFLYAGTLQRLSPNSYLPLRASSWSNEVFFLPLRCHSRLNYLLFLISLRRPG